MSKGGNSTGGMEASAAQSNALQKQMYEEGIARGKPFYDIGVGGANKLAGYLGIDTAPSRQSIYDTLAPQYTSQAPSELTGMYTRDGETRSGADLLHPSAGGTNVNAYAPSGGQTNEDLFKALGYTQTSAGTAPQVDYDALNAAVDTQFAEGQQRPDYYGSLLESFSPDKFQEDPSYDFIKSENEKALARTAAAKGYTYSPRAAMELQDRSTNLASTEYNNAYNRYNTDQTNIYNRLAGILGVGQTQAGQAQQAGQQYAGQVGETNTSLANAQAAAAQAKSAQKQSMFNTLVGAGTALATGGASLAALPAATGSYTKYTPQMLFGGR